MINHTVKAAEEAASGSVDLATLELNLRDASLKFARQVLGGLMSGPLQEAAGIYMPAGRRGERTTTIFTSVGRVNYRRHYIPQADGKSCFPADEAFGLVEKCTPMGAKLLCHEAARSQSYQQAAENISLVSGLDISASTIQRLVRVIGPDSEQWAIKRVPQKSANYFDIIAVIEMDMTGVRMLKKYLKDIKGKNGEPTCRQIKCGTCFLMQKDKKGVYQKLSGSIVHVLSFSDPTSFSAALKDALKKLGIPWDTPTLVVADGAEWIWNIVKDRFGNAVQIVDFWHAAENLNNLCQCAFGEGEEGAKAFKIWRNKLKRYGVNCVIKGFEKIATDKKNKKEIIERLEYFKNHKQRMQYCIFKKNGYPIGSGVIEGACKSLIKQRTSLSGQRWSPDGALDILWIRALIVDGLYDQYWKENRNRKRKARQLQIVA